MLSCKHRLRCLLVGVTTYHFQKTANMYIISTSLKIHNDIIGIINCPIIRVNDALQILKLPRCDMHVYMYMHM